MKDVERESRSLANLRHELRTPLNAIIGYSEMLLEDAEDEGQEGLIADLRRIHTAGKALLALVSDILDSQSVDAELDFQLRTSLNAIIGYAEMLLEDAEDEGREDLILDLQRIHAAAKHFLATISREIPAEAGRPSHVAPQIPAGAGRPSHVAPQIPAEAGRPSHVAPQIPAEAGRPSHVAPQPDREAAAISSTIQDAATAVCPPMEDDAGAVVGGRGYLLVVDDNEINRDILSRHLERQGHTVAVAENGRQALEMVSTHPFDLVLLDVMMPEMDGYRVLECLKGDEAWRDIPVIMISALDEIDSVVRCIELGAEDYLPKPFDPVLLRARIGACLEKKRLRDQEVEYLRSVARVTAAATAVEAGEFEPESLADVARRTDGLGRLARVFQRMAREVYAREERLKRQVHELRIELSQARQARQVAEITETDYFRQLQAEAQNLRDILEGTSE